MIKLRAKNQTSIQYNIIVGDSPLQSPILPPVAFNNNIIEFIKRCPFDLIQLNESHDYFQLSLKVIDNSPLDLNIINIKDFDTFFNNIKKIKQVQLYFFDSENENQVIAYNKLIDLKSELIYTYLFNSLPNELKNNKSIFIAAGVAHGFLAVEDDSITLYNVTTGYDKNCDSGILWNSFRNKSIP